MTILGEKFIEYIRWISLGWVAVFFLIVFQVSLAKYVQRRINAQRKFKKAYPNMKYMDYKTDCGNDIQVQMQQL